MKKDKYSLNILTLYIYIYVKTELSFLLYYFPGTHVLTRTTWGLDYPQSQTPDPFALHTAPPSNAPTLHKACNPQSASQVATYHLHILVYTSPSSLRICKYNNTHQLTLWSQSLFFFFNQSIITYPLGSSSIHASSTWSQRWVGGTTYVFETKADR